MATENIDIKAFGTTKTKEQAVKDGKDPDLTFSRAFPVEPDFSDELSIETWLHDVRACWGLKSAVAVFEKINKHIADNYRRQYHAPSGGPSAKVLMRFIGTAGQDIIDQVNELNEAGKTDEANEIIKSY